MKILHPTCAQIAYKKKKGARREGSRLYHKGVEPCCAWFFVDNQTFVETEAHIDLSDPAHPDILVPKTRKDLKIENALCIAATANSMVEPIWLSVRIKEYVGEVGDDLKYSTEALERISVDKILKNRMPNTKTTLGADSDNT